MISKARDSARGGAPLGAVRPLGSESTSYPLALTFFELINAIPGSFELGQ